VDNQVFRDDSRRRWRWLQAAFALLAVALFVLGAFFVRSLQVRAPTASASVKPVAAVDLAALGAKAIASAHADPSAARRDAEPLTAPRRDDAKPTAAAMRIAFVDATEQEGVRALEAHAGALTHAAVEVLHVRDDRGGLLGQLPDDLVALGRRRGLAMLEVVDSQRDDVSHEGELTAIGHDRVRTVRLARAIEAKLRADGAAGVVLVLGEDEADAAGAARAAIVLEVVERLRPAKMLVGVRVSGDSSPSVLAAEASVADFVVVDAYRGTNPGASPAPLAPRAWVERSIGDAVRVVPREKLVVAFGTRAIAWPVRASDLALAGPARELQWVEVMARARVAGVSPTWDAASGGLVVALPGVTGIPSIPRVRAHALDDGTLGMIAWSVDAATFADGRVLLARHGLASFALGKLGGEDSRLWRVAAGDPADRESLRAALETIPHAKAPDVIGDGVAMHVDFDEHDGRAAVELAIGGRVEREEYLELPAAPTVVRRGQVPSRTVVLTFDDGPNREFTPAVLDILREEHVKAAFFVVGSQVEREPRLLQRVAAEGHEIGNHSFSHPDLGKIAGAEADLQVNATNRLLEAVTGRSTVLFRPPFRSDGCAEVLEDLVAIENGERNGMITVTSNLDSLDWTRPEPDELVAYVVRLLEKRDGGVVLLHDGGGDRANTVKSLRPLIQTLRARGFTFAQVHDVFGYGDLAMVNPPVSQQHAAFVASKTVWYGGTFLLHAFGVLALLALALGLFRFAALAIGAALDRVEELRDRDALRGRSKLPRHLAVSVVIPAYNEAKVIERTILSVLGSRGVDVEIFVVDDGSTDDTADVVSKAFYIEPRVRLVRLENGGKARALNVGFELATHPIVVALDADTIFLPDTIVELARKFDDPRVAAVAGRAVVGNVNHFVGRWQALEYVIGQGIERRAWHLLGVVSVVPGAVGAWYRDRTIAAGGFGTDTLAEDCDLTITLQVRGYRVSYAPNAVALTEAPESVRALIKQRFRWCFGVLQTTWKHRGAMVHAPRGNRVIGMLLLPAILLSHLATPLLAPIADVAAVAAFALGNAHVVIPYAVALMIAELLLTLLALRLDRASIALMSDWLVNRFVYRWLLFIALARAVFAALRGGTVGWGKLVRTGTVRAPIEARRLSGEGKVTA
jgi:cellulose synthase/poly-beta-1,6-N-acetylglucosamine synthase-like glycosyltransferase/peptidoglycan/xylan/chitin deacetylase (PgdA/CDA1 family)